MGSTERPARWWALPILAGAFAAALHWLPILPALACGGVLALAGVALFGRSAWRLSALLTASLLLGFSAVEAVSRMMLPSAINLAVVKTYDPASWVKDDPELGYRPRAGVAVRAEARYGDELVFRQTYTIEPTGARATTGSREGRATYLFVGDSFIFGEGLADTETLPSQFAAHSAEGARVVNLGVPGHGPNHWVRAFETGLYDPHAVGQVAAVVTWIIPAQLPRLTGDEDWLGSSPRYVLDEKGQPHHTGSFAGHRLQDPVARVSYWARHRFASVSRATEPALERDRSRLYVALIARLRDLVRARYDAPLVLLYDWPDRELPGQDGLQYLPIFRALQALNIPLLSTRKPMGPVERWADFVIPHDSHPNCRLTAAVAAELTAFLDRADVAR
jgi:hypothetical protein